MEIVGYKSRLSRTGRAEKQQKAGSTFAGCEGFDKLKDCGLFSFSLLILHVNDRGGGLGDPGSVLGGLDSTIAGIKLWTACMHEFEHEIENRS